MMPYTVPDLLRGNGPQAMRRTAVIDGARCASYADLAEGARAYAGVLAELKVGPGERVALLLPRSIEALAAFFGAQYAGTVTVFISERLRPRQVAQIIADAGAAVAFTTPRLQPLLQDCRLAPDRIVDISTARRAPGAGVPARAIGRDLAVLAYTSGSTGSPKGVMLTHDALIAGTVIVADYLDLTCSDRTLALLPWSFDYGLNQALSTLYTGGTVVIQRSAFPPELCRTLADASVTGLAGVPSLWGLLRQRHSPFFQQQFGDLRYVTNSGGALSPDLVRDIRRAHPQAGLYLMYGLTEAFRSTYLAPELADTRPDSIGQAIPNTEILVVSDGRPCGPGEPGELVHRGPTAGLGYWQDAEATARTFRAHPFALADPARPETVVYSGDYVRADADGYLYYLGRRDEQFKSRGIRVSPAEIEAEILSSGMIAEAVVFSRGGTAIDPVIVAAVLPADQDSFSLPVLMDYCRSELPPHMLPARVVPVPAMPRTSTGKTDRAAVRTRLAAAGVLADDQLPAPGR
jgi:amino acid adenylation domain-containing protein